MERLWNAQLDEENREEQEYQEREQERILKLLEEGIPEEELGEITELEFTPEASEEEGSEASKEESENERELERLSKLLYELEEDPTNPDNKIKIEQAQQLISQIEEEERSEVSEEEGPEKEEYEDKFEGTTPEEKEISRKAIGQINRLFGEEADNVGRALQLAYPLGKKKFTKRYLRELAYNPHNAKLIYDYLTQQYKGPFGTGLSHIPLLGINPYYVRNLIHPSNPTLSLVAPENRTYGLPFRGMGYPAHGLDPNMIVNHMNYFPNASLNSINKWKGGSREYKQRILDDSENYDLGRAANYPY